MLLYLVTASGFALNLHYCGKTLQSVKIDAPAKKCGPVKMKCCRDKHLEVKVKDTHKSAASHSLLSKLFMVDLPKLPFEEYLFPEQEIAANISANRGPPDGGCKTPVYIKNCTFRI